MTKAQKLKAETEAAETQPTPGMSNPAGSDMGSASEGPTSTAPEAGQAADTSATDGADDGSSGAVGLEAGSSDAGSEETTPPPPSEDLAEDHVLAVVISPVLLDGQPLAIDDMPRLPRAVFLQLEAAKAVVRAELD